MKAKIDQFGTLRVIAENELEAYALRKWSDDYASQDESRTPVLHLDYGLGDHTARINVELGPI